MDIAVLARMTVADELRRQKRLGLNVLNDDVVSGLIQQRQKLETQQEHSLRFLAILVLLSFVAWQGGNIKIPGTGASVAEIPAFLEISLVLAAYTLMWLPYNFLNIQIYDGVIQSIAKHIQAENLIDEDIVVASRMPTQMYLKYARDNIVIGRKNGYKISMGGKIYNSLLVGLLVFAFFLLFVFLFLSVIVIAHFGLGDGLVGWSVYTLCWTIILIGVFATTANFVNSTYELDFNELENFDPASK